MAAVQAAPGIPARPVETYSQVPESKAELPWADLVTLDLSQFDAPGGKQKLAQQLADAVHNVGFFYITNFGLSQEEVDRQFAIGRDIFELPMEEKLKHEADMKNGHYSGYRRLGISEIVPGLKDNIEMYNLFKFNGKLERSQPDIIHENRAEIEKFQRHIAQDTVQKLLTLISIILELPEDHLSQGHSWDDISDCHLRYMIYRARSPEDNARAGGLYSKGHTDFGSLTLLFRQPVAALQVRMPDGSWKWVKPFPGSITVNIADVLQFWTNGFLKSSIHRVVVPPEDQANKDRLGLLYFLRPSHDLKLATVDSPLLRRLGLKADGEADGIKAVDWVRARVKGNLDKPDSRDSKVGKPVLNGVTMKYYD